MNNDDTAAILNDLIKISKDGEEGFRTSAELVNDESLKKTFADPLIKKKMANRKLRSSYNMTDDVKDKISNTLKNKYLTGSIQNGMLGKKHSTNTLEKFKKPKNKITCPYCNKIGGQGNMVRYHLENCKNKKYEK